MDWAEKEAEIIKHAVKLYRREGKRDHQYHYEKLMGATAELIKRLTNGGDNVATGISKDHR